MLLHLNDSVQRVNVNLTVTSPSVYTFAALSCDPDGATIRVDYHLTNPGGGLLTVGCGEWGVAVPAKTPRVLLLGCLGTDRAGQELSTTQIPLLIAIPFFTALWLLASGVFLEMAIRQRSVRGVVNHLLHHTSASTVHDAHGRVPASDRNTCAGAFSPFPSSRLACAVVVRPAMRRSTADCFGPSATACC